MIPLVNTDPVMGLLDTETGHVDWDNKDEINKVVVEEEAEFKQRLLKTREDEELALTDIHNQLEEISCDTDEIEQIMKKALVSMEKTRKIVESIDGVEEILKNNNNNNNNNTEDCDR